MAERLIPISTKRLLLREFLITDIQSYYDLESTEESARYQDWPPKTMEQCLESVLSTIRDSHAIPRKVFEFIVEKDGCMIGRVGAALSRLEDGDESRPAIRFNLWYSFFPSEQGKGYATEAMEALIGESVKRQNGDVELEIECDPRNTGSWKLAERLGFKKHSLTERAYESKGEWVDSLVYRKTVGGAVV